MSKSRVTIMIATAVVSISAFGLRPHVQGQDKQEGGFAAIPGEKGGQDIFGPYEVVQDWPKPLSQLPGHENWTWGTMNSVFAESPNQVFIVQRGEIPLLQKRPPDTPIPQFGPSLSFPVEWVPLRNTGVGPLASPRGPEGDTGESANDKWKGKYGVDARWEHVILVVDSEGRIVESWTQWDKLIRRAHFIAINPYDPAKAVWVVDDLRQVIFKFSNDGKKLLQTIGTLNEQGDDDKHFGGETCLAWLPDGTFFVSDGYKNNRVVKFDKNGKFLMAWGQKGNAPHEMRPGYFNTPHALVVDPVTRRVFVNDRENGRIQVFDENGKFLDQWPTLPPGTTAAKDSWIYPMYMSADRHLWVADAITSKILEYDLEGHLLYSWGSFGDRPGEMWGPHGISVDQEGNLYVSEVYNGRVQKFRPRKGANPNFLVGKPVRDAWK